jgi:hypothetical protein
MTFKTSNAKPHPAKRINDEGVCAYFLFPIYRKIPLFGRCTESYRSGTVPHELYFLFSHSLILEPATRPMNDNGVFFAVLKQGKSSITRKFVMVK